MVRSPAIFLRSKCLLPDGIHLEMKPFFGSWMSVENAVPAQLDLAVRNAGWHFLWIEKACTRNGWGWSDEEAITRAITRALVRAGDKFDAAELSFIRVSRYLGLRIAKVTMYARHIQQGASLDMLDGSPIPQLV